MTGVAGESLGIDEGRMAVLSGPSFALEVARGHPTAVVVASSSMPLAVAIQEAVSSETLRLYTNDDPVGVQVCGALKNVVAIASGVITGMGLGANSVAALVTRGLAEMQRLGSALGGRASTFAGLAGVGDLILTATGELSRNRRVGVELGRGRSPAEILAGMTMVAEGVRTADAASQLAARESVEMPIVDQVRRVLYDGIAPGEAIAELMARRLRSEG
jgi:glycerol-3-phosphate dehydrogenase (NAD(P)+)